MDVAGRKTKWKRCDGQIMSEYAIALVMLSLVAVVLLSLVFFFSLYGGRLVNLISIEYP